VRRLTLKQRVVLERLRSVQQPVRPRDLMPLKSQHEATERDDWPPGSGRCWHYDCGLAIPHGPMPDNYDYTESAIRSALNALEKRGILVRSLGRPARYHEPQRSANRQASSTSESTAAYTSSVIEARA
jgi:hypothetical protein